MARFTLPPYDPLLRDIPLKARVTITCRCNVWRAEWNDRNRNIDIGKGIEGEVYTNQNLSALQRRRTLPENITIYFATCTHAMRWGSFQMRMCEIHEGDSTVEIGPPGNRCSWCRGAEWVSIKTISRAYHFPPGMDTRIGSYLSYELKDKISAQDAS